MKQMKRILSLALALVMVLGMAPVMTFAAEAAPALPTAKISQITNDDLTFAMNFRVDSVTEEQLAYYGSWYADFELTVNKEVTFNNDGSADGWLAGQYDEWSLDWVTVPFGKKAPVTLAADQPLKIMAFAAEFLDEPGLKYTFKEVYESVKNFNCGVYFDNEFLFANPDLTVTLELKMYNPANEAESYVVGESYTYTNPIVARNINTGKVYNSVNDAMLDCTDGQTVLLLKDVSETVVYVLENGTLDLNGHALAASYVTSYGDIIDSSADNTGALCVPANRLYLRNDNAQLPINDGTGYRFAQVLKIDTRMLSDYKLAFQPRIEPSMQNLLVNGADVTGVTIRVKVTWKQGNGYRSQDFVYNDSFVKGYLSSYDAATDKYSKMFTLTLNAAEDFEELTFTAVIVSDAKVSFTPNSIQNQKPVITPPASLNAVYGQTLADVVLPDGFAWKNSSASVGAAGTNSFVAVHTASNTEFVVVVVVSKADPECTIPTGLTATYGDTLADVALPEGFAWVDASASVGNAGINTFPAIFTPADANYNAVEVEIAVTVAKIDPECTAPTGLTATYGDTLAEVVLPEGFSWVDASASVGNAGTNTFLATFTPADTENYNTIQVEVPVNVFKADPDVNYPTEYYLPYGTNLTTFTLPEGFAWKESVGLVGNVGTHTYIVVYTPQDIDNYNTIEIPVIIHVSKINPSVDIPENLTATYGDTLADVVLPEGFVWVDATASVGNAGVNSFTAIFTPEDIDNYNTVEVTISVTVNKANPSPEIPAGLQAEEGQTLADVELPEGFVWIDDSASVGNAGINSFVAIFTPDDTNNYNWVKVSIPVEVIRVDVAKFASKFTGDFLYRIGNANEVKLGQLFAAVKSITGTVNVTIETVTGATGTYTANATWTEGTIQFTGTGVVKVTITDNDHCIPTELYLEVVDATNVTSASGTISSNVVLLNDAGLNSLTVSGNYTFYGNGFTLTYTGNGQYLNNGLKKGLVTVSENGTLDNLRIKASIYPSAYLYYGYTLMGDYVQGGPSSVEGDKTRYHYQLSAVAASGNATISNCYIYGGRTNIFVDTGDVTITDTVLECGTVANVQIQSTSSHTVTLNNVTTIQKRVNATIGDTSRVMLGAGVLVGPDTTSNPKIVLSGSFKQYNWVNNDDQNAVSDELVKAIVGGALEATAYNHTINGQTASNLGIIYMNTEAATVVNNTGLPYQLGEIKMTLQNNTTRGQVYSLQNATADQIFSDIENADRETVNGDYMPKFDFNLGDQAISYDGNEDNRYLYGDANGVIALYQDGNAALSLDLSKLASIYKYTGRNYTVTAVLKNASGAILGTNQTVELKTEGNYTLVFTVEDNIFYDKNGNTVEKSVTRTFSVPLTLTVKAADIKNAVVNITKTTLDGEYITANLTDYKLRIDFLDCISVTDYDTAGNGSTVNLKSNISSVALTPSGVNVFTTSFTATITYNDGRVLTVNFSKISGSSPGTKTATVNSSGYFITDGALDNKPTESKNQNKCTITSVSFKGTSGSTVTNDTDVTVTWELGSSGGSSPCVTGDTLVTLADGTTKRIDEITSSDLLLVWNFFEGKYDVAPAAIIFDHGADYNTVIKLIFSDGTTVNVVNMHQFFNVELNQLVTIKADTVADFVGTHFVKYDGNNNVSVELVAYEITEEYIEAWGVITALHYNILVADMLSADFDLPDVALFNYFEVGEGMKFDEAKMQADIEKYGLYTYEDFADYLTYEQFVAFNVQYFKIPVGKGNYTYEGILQLIQRYL